MTRIITIAGQEKCDIVYYLSVVLRAMKKHTLVIDNSYSKDLFEALWNNESDYVIERGLSVYTKDMNYSRDAFESFDIVIFYEGYNICAANIRQSSRVFIITDYSECAIRQTREAFEKVKPEMEDVTEFYYILRDKMSGKISDRLAFSEFSMTNCRLAGTIPFDNTDYCRYIDFSYNGIQTVRGASDGIKEALVFILSELEHTDRRTVLKKINKL